MDEQKKSVAALTEEQLDALALSFFPAMCEFFSSERGKQIWAEHLREIEQGYDKVA